MAEQQNAASYTNFSCAASQIMYFVVLAFLCFNCYRLGYALGINQNEVNATQINASVFEIKVSSCVNLCELLTWHHPLLVGGAYWVQGRISKKATEKSCI